MACRQHDRGRCPPMRQRNSGCGSGTEGRCDTGNDFVFDVGPAQRVHLFAGAAEDQRVSTLQANDLRSCSGARHHQKVDLLLPDSFAAAPLAHVLNLGGRRNQSQDFGRDQVVVQHDVGRPEQPQRFHRQQFGIARTRAHQVHLTVHTVTSLSISFLPCSSSAAFRASRLASECNRSLFLFGSRSLASTSFRVSPSSATHWA